MAPHVATLSCCHGAVIVGIPPLHLPEQAENIRGTRRFIEHGTGRNMYEEIAGSVRAWKAAFQLFGKSGVKWLSRRLFVKSVTCFRLRRVWNTQHETAG